MPKKDIKREKIQDSIQRLQNKSSGSSFVVGASDRRELELSTGFGLMLQKTMDDEFLYIPLSSIVIEEQIRKVTDTTSDEFKALVESIREKGVIQPVIVTKGPHGRYLLVAGERRYRAAEMLGRETIPSRIVPISGARDMLLTRLFENISREDLNPMDEAEAYFEFFKLSTADPEEVTLSSIMNDLTTHRFSPDRLDGAIADTVSAAVKMFGKSSKTLERMLSLINLREPAKEALRDKKISLTQGYVFSSNVDHSRFEEVLQDTIKNSWTASKIKAEFAKKIQATTRRPISPEIMLRNIRALGEKIEKITLTKFEAKSLMAEIEKVKEALEKAMGSL